MIAYTFMDAYRDFSVNNKIENRIIYSKDTVARNVDRDEEIKKIRNYAISLMTRVLVLEEMRGFRRRSTIYKIWYDEFIKIFNDTFLLLKKTNSFSSVIDYQFTREDMRLLRESLEKLLGDELRSQFPYHKLKELHVTIKYKIYLQLLDNTLFGDSFNSTAKHVYIQDLLDKYDSLFIKI